LKFSSAVILIAVLVVLSALVFVLTRQRPPAASVVAAEASIAQDAHTAASALAVQPIVEQGPQSEAAAVKVLADLKHFQAAVESDIDYNTYEKKLNGLKSSLNETLPSFVRHEASDETFREEVAAAVREYTAAGNWWKTTITNSTVFTETDRHERTQKNFESARMHLTNAEKMLIR
jgi:uncharacterized protein (TIGR02588 family)